MRNIVEALPSIRPPFLTLAPLCTLLGLAFCHYQGIELNILHAVFAMIGALFAAIAVNTINEYQDIESGLDLLTVRTPFSGGSGLLKDKPELINTVKRMALFSVGIVLLIGIYFVMYVPLLIIPIGVIGLLIVTLYTRFLNKRPWLCFIAPGLGFGILMPLGAYVTQTSSFSVQLLLITLIPFLIANCLLLINQFPDIDADRKIGRNHLSIRYGVHTAILVFAVSILASIAILMWLVFTHQLPYSALFCLVPVGLCLASLIYLVRLKDNIAEHLPAMGLVAASANLTPLSLSLILFFS